MAAGTWQPSHMAVRKGNGKVGNVNWTKRAFVQSFGEAICCKRGSLTGFMKWALPAQRPSAPGRRPLTGPCQPRRLPGSSCSPATQQWTTQQQRGS
eukprot:scaffold44225_cov19-Tisochrysis_lutea.AAC.1